MRIKKNLKKYILILASALAVLLLGAGAGAESVAGSITLQFPEETQGVDISIYTVADYRDGAFVYRPEFEGCGIDLTGIREAEEAQQAAEHFWMIVQENNLSGYAQTVSGGTLVFGGLQPGYYLMVQTAGEMVLEVQKMLAPIPYMTDGNVLAYDAVLVPKYEVPEGAAILQKQDDDAAKVTGAVFTLQRKVYVMEDALLPIARETGLDVGGRFVWEDYRTDLVTDDNGQIVMENLPLGLYRLVETKAPAGYFLNTAPSYFEVKTGGTVKLDGMVYVPDEGGVEQVTVIDDQTKVEVNKVDEDGKPVGEAYLAVKTGDGQPILNTEGHPKFAFTTSGDGSYTLKQLPPGDYLLSELVSPVGYLPAQDVPFTVSADPDAQNEVTMVDETEDETVEVLRVTKHLYDGLDDMLTAREGSFYVALFEDPERTVRVSDVKELHFAGTSSDTVEFLNLEPGKTYYLGETDEFGTLLEGGLIEDVVYSPEYPDGYEVTLVDDDPETDVELRNVFYNGLPPGFYISGDITVTKVVLMGGEECPSDDVFYAGIFEDPELTQLYGGVLEIPMNGGSVASAVMTDIFIGEDADSQVTYYVTETDEYGNPLDPDAVQEFTFTVDGGEVTLSASAPSAQVVITNHLTEIETEYETSYETETYEQTEPQTPASPSSPSSPSNPGTPTGTTESSKPVKTGDDTPIRAYIILLAAAAILFGAGTIAKRKRRQR